MYAGAVVRLLETLLLLLVRFVPVAVALLVGVAVPPAHAQVYKVVSDAGSAPPIEVTGPSCEAAADAYYAARTAADENLKWDRGGNVCEGGPVEFRVNHSVQWKRTGSHFSGGWVEVRKIEDPGTGAEHCKAQMGKDTTVNWTVGYSRYPAGHAQAYDLISPPNKVPGDGLMCVGGCKVAAEYGESTSTAYRSASPTAQGTYRLSMDFKATQLGEHCAATQSDAPADPKAPIPTCPGNVGEVNGVTVCTGTAAAPVRNDTPGQEPAGAQEGNPAAGPKPGSGEGAGTGGAGRTPSTGDGGPGGGPAGAAGTGKGPDGTTNKPGEGKEQAACGAPGQPKCRIDESGTPDGKGAFDGISKGADEAKKNWTDEIDKWKERKADGWTWTFQLPSGCAPLAMDGYGFQIDVCRFQPVIHDIMSMVWAIATVWGCMLLVFNASGKN